MQYIGNQIKNKNVSKLVGIWQKKNSKRLKFFYQKQYMYSDLIKITDKLIKDYYIERIG
mgnify:FL=1